MRTIRRRLLLTHTILATVSICLFSFYIMSFVEHVYTTHIEQLALSEARVTAAVAAQLQSRGETAAELARTLSDAGDFKLDFYSPSGKALSADTAPLSASDLADAENSGYTSTIGYDANTNGQALHITVPAGDTGAPKAKTAPDSIGFLTLTTSLGDVVTLLGNLWEAIGWSVLVVAVASALLSWRIARSLADPLGHITDVAERIANGDTQQRARVFRSDELGALANSVNTMATRLREQIDDLTREKSKLEGVLTHMVSGVVVVDASGRITLANPASEELFGTDMRGSEGVWHWQATHSPLFSQSIDDAIALRTSVRKEVRLSLPVERTVEIHVAPVFQGDGAVAGAVAIIHDVSERRRLERMRSEFVANVSHELQTPMTAVRGFAETLLDGAMADPETAASFIKIIYDESERLGRLVTDLLELSKMESDRPPVRMAKIDLRDVAHRSVTKLQLQAERADITLYEALGDTPAPVVADPDRLDQVLVNLISNALTYTPRGGSVTVQIDAREREIMVHVVDTGIGIPPEHIPRLFERFYRVDQARSRRSGGTGLGLAIAKHIIEAHQGRIGVTSMPGKGSDFYFVLRRDT